MLKGKKSAICLTICCVMLAFAYAAAAKEKVAYGKYLVTKREEVGGTMQSQATLKKIRYVEIRDDKFSDYERGYLAGICDSRPNYVVGPAQTGDGTAAYYGLGKAKAGLTVTCGGKFVAYFDVLSAGRLGTYLDGYYFFLEREKQSEPLPRQSRPAGTSNR